MAERIEFTRNYSDLSTNRGFQFEFYCDRCNSGFRTQFKQSATGTINDILDVAGSLLGGLFGKAADVSEHVNSASWQNLHDQAFTEAMNELKGEFIQCPNCLSWVCRRSCWNTHKGLCKNCAPDLGVEMAAAQSSVTVQNVWDTAQVSETDKQNIQTNSWKENIRGTCQKCEAALPPNVKFCPECGEKVISVITCSGCGTKVASNHKFCPECGKKI